MLPASAAVRAAIRRGGVRPYEKKIAPGSEPEATFLRGEFDYNAFT